MLLPYFLRRVIIAMATMISIDLIWFFAVSRFAGLAEVCSMTRISEYGLAPNSATRIIGYLVLSIMLVHFSWGPNALAHTFRRTLHAASLGFSIFLVYELANYATLNLTNALLSIAGASWGAFIFAGSSLCISASERLVGFATPAKSHA